MLSGNPLSLNRTFVELKQNGSVDAFSWHTVLIEPLWNWNRVRSWAWRWMACLNRTFVELKLSCTVSGGGGSVSLNRTFVELKPQSSFDGCQRIGVLIEPLWNWNRRTFRPGMSASRRLNRTFVELKQLHDLQKQWNQESLNRTFVELKLLLRPNGL